MHNLIGHCTRRKQKVFYFFYAAFSSVKILLEMGENIFFEEICYGEEYEAAESFEDKACNALVVLNCVSLLMGLLCCFYSWHVPV